MSPAGISPLRELVDAAVFSYEAGVAKPDQAAYAAAADRMGVAPASSVFVGDGGSDELVGAEAAGMRPIRAGWFVAPWGSSVATALARRWQDLEVADEPEELVQRLATGRGN
jgi:FMN phosphatase YigB (HAD superfamily)